MRDKTICPIFSEEEYKGQDVVHEGVRIPLAGYTSDEVFAMLSRRAQRIIKDRTDEVKFELTVHSDLIVLQSMWFDPNDATFPVTLDGHIGITARYRGAIIGGALFATVGHDGKILFLHQLVSGPLGKEMQVPTLLLWDAIQRFCKKGWHSIDVGVSYNPKRYEFFRNFAAQTYPVILKRPFCTPVIRLTPFRIMNDPSEKGGEVKLGEMVTFLPRGSHALLAALKHIGVGAGDRVNIVKTFGSNYISGCVTKAIEKTGALWSLREPNISKDMKALLVIHEFGVPVFSDVDLKIIDDARAAGIPIIEDCAWRASRVYEWSDYAVMSISKMYPLNYGGLLLGVTIDDETLWKWGILDVVKRDRFLGERVIGEGADIRRRNWKVYHTLVLQNGMTPDDCYAYDQAIAQGTWVPTVYLQRFSSEQEAKEVVGRLEEFGIQAGVYWGEPVVFLPIHQNMTVTEVEYMFAVVAGYFNLCKDYGKTNTAH